MGSNQGIADTGAIVRGIGGTDCQRAVNVHKLPVAVLVREAGGATCQWVERNRGLACQGIEGS